MPCKTPKCETDRAFYASLESKKNIPPLDYKDYNIDSNIYAIIAASIAGLICLSLVGAAALRKLSGDE